MARLKSVKAFTLVESLVAMVILLTGFGVSMAAFVNTTGSRKQHIELEARMLAKEIAYEIKSNDKMYDDQINTGFGKMVIKIVPWYQLPSLQMLSIKAVDDEGSTICLHNELISVR